MRNDSKPTHAYDAKRLYDEVECGGCAPAVYASPRDVYMEAQAIAEAQDRHSDWDELMASFNVLHAHFDTFRNRFADMYRKSQKIDTSPERVRKAHRRVCTPAETAYLASFSPNPRGELPTAMAGLINSRCNLHPMMAEALRAADEKLHGPESRL